MFEDMFGMFNKDEEKDEDTEIIRPERETYSSPPVHSVVSNVTVISVGGSILMDGKPKAEAILAISNCLNELIRQGHNIVLVVGGGKVARDYVNAAKELGANNFELDKLGIKITRANASLLIISIENAFPKVLRDVSRAGEILANGKTPIYGGLIPGFTTDAVAALIAESLGARFINLSNVDGIFTADPSAYPSARMYTELNHSKLIEILAGNAMKPGQNLILDLPAAMILKRSQIPALFLNGHDLENVTAAVQGTDFKGTIVMTDSDESIEGEEEVKKRVRKAKKKKTAKKSKVKKTRDFYEDDEEPHPDNIKF